jgi:hypothetical protein
MIDITPGAAAADANRLGGWIDPDATHSREIDDQAVIADSQSGGIVPAAANGRGQVAWRANSTQAITSATSAQLAISRGWRSNIPLYTFRAAS